MFEGLSEAIDELDVPVDGGLLVEAVRLSDRFPGCDRPISWCHAHHITHWTRGGTTDPGNIALFCERHHTIIHRPRWQVKLLPTGTIEVTDPQGRVRTSDPPG